jgi:release factor glutamine methyltransferase
MGDAAVTAGPSLPGPRPSDRDALVSAIAVRLGSVREARWIVDHGGAAQAQGLADRRAAGEPLQYVLGRWPFRSVDLWVDRRVLIPRPETEQVVEVALAEWASLCQESPSDPVRPGDRRTQVCVDLGTGSGGIALSLATEGAAVSSDFAVWATDLSPAALAVAEDNRDLLATADPAAAARVTLVGGSWFEALPPDLRGEIDLLVSNPPYVATADFPGLDPSVRDWEPVSALVAGDGLSGVAGMAAVEEVIVGAAGWLRRPGALVVEIDPRQADAAREVARSVGFGRVVTLPDLTGRTRMVVAGW